MKFMAQTDVLGQSSDYCQNRGKSCLLGVASHTDIGLLSIAYSSLLHRGPTFTLPEGCTIKVVAHCIFVKQKLLERGCIFCESRQKKKKSN